MISSFRVRAYIAYGTAPQKNKSVGRLSLFTVNAFSVISRRPFHSSTNLFFLTCMASVKPPPPIFLLEIDRGEDKKMVACEKHSEFVIIVVAAWQSWNARLSNPPKIVGVTSYLCVAATRRSPDRAREQWIIVEVLLCLTLNTQHQHGQSIYRILNNIWLKNCSKTLFY